ncbi:hypothetical protein O3M35_004541 [Rhynocoris fuscipes]|uniref:Phospholipid/glycerol acyltransferase domain-containing protein n=1 Tax=Rhynocoris fuscipes TaxID=488301 RepID=A0AAW1CLQ3_9HEMI
MGTNFGRARAVLHVRDILLDMSERGGSLIFWHKQYVDYLSAYISDIKPTLGPDHLKLLILNDKNLRTFLDEPKEYLEHLVNEIACSYSVSIIQWLSVIVIKILTGSINSLLVTERALNLTLERMGENPIIFLPTHRSYGDFILMALVCFYYKIQLPCVAAGIDFHSMKGTSYLLRKCKAFFMRRKFSNDRKYKTVFQQYFQNLISEGESPLEFFIEGTRSRTNKALVPKFGLLSMALEVFISEQVADLVLVPVAITYERLIEQHIYVNELLGIPKPKESTTAMFKAYMSMEEDYGKVLFSFGQPISIRDWYNDNYAQYLDQEHQLDYAYVSQHLAYTIVNEQVQLEPVLPINVLAFVLSMETCFRPNWAISLEETACRCIYLLRHCERLRVAVSAMRDYFAMKQEIMRLCKLHESVISLDDHIITYQSLSHYKPPNLYHLSRNFSEDDIRRLTPIITVQLYVNPMLRVFIGPAIILCSLKVSYYSNKDSLYGLFVKIARFFKNEFVTLLTEEFQELFLKSLEMLKREAVLDEDNEYIYSNSYIKDCLQAMMDPFIRGFINCCSILMNSDCISESDLIRQTQNLGLNMWKNEEIFHPYCITRDLISNCIKTLVELNYIKKEERNGVTIYFAVRKKVRELSVFFAWMLRPLADTIRSQM